MKNKGRLIRCDDTFYDMIKESGYSAPVFTRKIAEQLINQENKEIRGIKKQNTIWGFKL